MKGKEILKWLKTKPATISTLSDFPKVIAMILGL